MAGKYRFDGQVAVVTGAGSGLGRRHATALARLGATVVLNDIRREQGGTLEEETADGVVALLAEEGITAFADKGDIGDEDYARGLIERTVARHGRIDVVVNNAGMHGFGAIQDTPTALMNANWRVNLMGAFWTSNQALQHMRAAGYGRIVNTASALGAFGGKEILAYSTTKAAVIGMTKAAAQDNTDKNIRINAICPVAITPMSRKWLTEKSAVDPALLVPELASPVVLYLAHADCGITGQVLSGGMGVWASIFTAKTEGVPATDDLDDVFANLDGLLATQHFTVLSTSADQYSDDQRNDDQDGADRDGADRDSAGTVKAG